MVMDLKSCERLTGIFKQGGFSPQACSSLLRRASVSQGVGCVPALRAFEQRSKVRCRAHLSFLQSRGRAGLAQSLDSFFVSSHQEISQPDAAPGAQKATTHRTEKLEVSHLLLLAIVRWNPSTGLTMNYNCAPEGPQQLQLLGLEFPEERHELPDLSRR